MTDLVGRLRARRVDRPVRIMEVCGTHTMSAHRAGLYDLLPEGVSLVSGPGCPVCVTPVGYVDRAVALARLPEVTITTFGDLIRVPGSTSSLEKERAAGRDVRVVYSPLDALNLAERHPERTVIFLGVGFETTAPVIGSTVLRAQQMGLENFRVLCAHKLVPPALDALLDSGELALDALMGPGHVSAIIGTEAYRPVAERYGCPVVVAGFEPEDMIEAVLLLLDQRERGENQVLLQYRRAVRPAGNPRALAVMEQVFRPADSTWRGLGEIPGSGLVLREEYRRFDAEAIAVEVEPAREPRGCACGEILRGVKRPAECPLFGRACTPEQPVGPCMVSSEGSCAAAYRYGRR